MLGNPHFYNRTIRKIVVAFGTLFNDIVLVRYNKAGTEEYERTRVPLSYGAKEKYLTRLTSDPSLTKSINVYVPRISFDLVGISYDPSRKFNTLNRNYAVNSQDGTVSAQYSGIPYNFDFDLNIFVRNTEDGTQILEQILPFFTPDFTVTVDLMPKIGRKYDMPVVLNSVTPEIDYEGDMSTTRMIIWNLNFTVKGYIFPSANPNINMIKSANTNVYYDSRNKNSQKIYVDMASGNGVFTTGETVRIKNKDKTGTVIYFANNNSGTLIVSSDLELFEEDEVIVGDYSNAEYTINTVDLNPLKIVSIVTQPDPTTASPDDDFGFNDNITQFPNTLL